jgi:hypothetical protein
VEVGGGNFFGSGRGHDCSATVVRGRVASRCAEVGGGAEEGKLVVSPAAPLRPAAAR